MRENPKHQFAAVMFADIVGYTALMQDNEKEALIKLKKFKLILETVAAANKGQIIQFYGDGCLVVFEETTAALFCAIALQQAFRANEAVPVRIGLHEGDVIFRDNNVFGHTVNIASRIESMGISGAVLMSHDFQESVKHNIAFEFQALGAFNLKNVKESISLYALANKGLPIPSQSELRAAADKTKRGSSQKKYTYLYWLIPSLIAIGLGGLFWRTYQSSKMDAQVLKERIAVLPFKNNTNNPDLAILGNMAADWISTGLMSVENAEVVSPFTVRTHQAAIGILANDAQNRPSFAELTGAKNLITGAYYEDNGNIICKLELVDALDGQLRFSFKEIKGKATEKEILLTKLREQVTGYWAAKDLVDANKIAPPNLEAYQLYLDNLQKMGTEADLLKILAIDSTFYLPRIHALNIQTGDREGVKNNHIAFLDRHTNQLSAYEKAWFIYLKGLYLGQPMVSFESLDAIRQKYPKDFLLNHSTANIALEGLHNPELALAIYGELPLVATQSKAAGVYWNKRLLNMVTCFIELDQPQAATQLLKEVLPNPGIDNNFYLKTRLIEALVRNNNELAYEQLKTSLKTKPFHYFWVNIELMQSNLLTDEFRQQQEADMVKAYEQLPPNDINRLLWKNFIAVAANDEQYLSLKYIEKLPTGLQIGNLAIAGQFYINNEQPAKAQPMIERLKNYTNCGYGGQVKSTCAAAYHYMGTLQAETGQTKKALESLSKAKQLGLGMELHRFQYSRYLTVLFDLPEFQELQQPVWPTATAGEIVVTSMEEYYQTPDKLTDITNQFKLKGAVELEPYNHFFKVKLGIANNYNDQKVAFHYQLAEMDKDWKVAVKKEINMGNLPYGQQTLRIKAQFPNGQFTKQLLEIPIRIPRPFYLNIEFLIGIIGLIFVGVYFGGRFRIPQRQ